MYRRLLQRLGLRGGGSSFDLLAVPVVRQYSGWFGKQTDYVQGALIVLAVALAFLLAVAGGWILPARLTAQEAKAQAIAEPVDLAGVLYALNDGQPKPPKTGCQPFQTSPECSWKQIEDMATYQEEFSEHVGQLKDEKNRQEVIWTRKGDEFPKYDSGTGQLVFTFGLEGKGQGKPKTAPTPAPSATPSPLQQKVNKLLAKIPLGKGDTEACVPMRIIAGMPLGINAGIWADQGDGGTKVKPFPHPCLRAPEWKAVTWVLPETAKEWDKRAKAEGWKLEMSFRVEEWEGPFRPDWDEDAHLSDGDLLLERRVWLAVDEVRLVIGDLVVNRWNASP